MYTCQWTHIVCKPPPPLSEQVCHVRAQRAGVCVCARIARARVRTIRAGAHAPYARAARAHCTCSPFARAVREPYARTVRKKCAPKSAVFFQNLLPFVENLLRFFKICCDFLHVRSTRVVAVRYGARARARTVCTRALAHKLYARSARALYVRTARAHCTYRTRTVRPDCTQKVCAKICCVLFKICCVFSKSVVFFQNLLCFLYVRSARTVAVRHGARARAVYVRATRAREIRTRAHRARALYVPYTRTVLADCTEKVCAKFRCVVFRI